jgi:hypothetical protein
MELQLSKWFEHIQTPNSIGKYPICPFAAAAIKNNKVSIQGIEDVSNIETLIESIDILEYDVTILYLLEYKKYTIEELRSIIILLNSKFNSVDKVILENEPRTPFFVNGVQTTFDDCYLILIQSLSKLNKHAEILKGTDYYSYWTKNQIDEVITWRYNEKTT